MSITKKEALVVARAYKKRIRALEQEQNELYAECINILKLTDVHACLFDYLFNGDGSAEEALKKASMATAMGRRKMP